MNIFQEAILDSRNQNYVTEIHASECFVGWSFGWLLNKLINCEMEIANGGYYTKIIIEWLFLFIVFWSLNFRSLIVGRIVHR